MPSDPAVLDARRQEEKKTVRIMIGIYCRGQKHLKKEERPAKDALCPDCQALWEYTAARIEHCPRMAEKTFCSCCPVHCYKPDMQQKIRLVMRYAGPRMLLVRPADALRHAFLTMRFRRQQKKG